MESADKQMRLDDALEEPLQWGGASHAFLRNGILVVIACDVAFNNLLLVVAPEQTVRAYAVLVLIAMLVAAWILLRRGKSKAAVTTVVVVG